MKNLKNDYYMGVLKGAIEYQIDFEEIRIDEKIETFPIASIASLDLIDSIENDQNRNKKYYDSQRNKNVILGAAAGGVVDAMIGGDDSLINGILLGAGAGYIFTDEKQDPKAKIAIAFKDGRSLALEVDQDELTALIAEIKALKNDLQKNIDHQAHRELTQYELNNVMSYRERLTKWMYAEYVIIPFALALIAFFILNYFELNNSGEIIQNEIDNTLINDGYGLGKAFTTPFQLIELMLSFGLTIFIAGNVMIGIYTTIKVLMHIKRLPSLNEWQIEGFQDEEEFRLARKLGLIKTGEISNESKLI